MTMHPSKTTRRDFLKAAGLSATMTAGVLPRWSFAQTKSPNEKLNIACIGTANRAAASVNAVSGENVVALCDVDEKYLEAVKEKFPEAKTYVDYREMLDQMADKLDAVVVATADHHHIPASIRAVRAGKHVYCEKPLSHTVFESRLINEEAQKQGVATQLGTQIHATDNYRRVVELVQAGAIGDVTDVHVWCGKSWGGGERPEGGEEPPETLHWDLWLGPAPERPYVKGRYHPGQWRRWWDFGNGTLGDMACHLMDLPFWALKLRYPSTCEAEGPEVHPETCPLGLTVRYTFPAEEGYGPLNLTWYDGNQTPKEVAGEKVPGMGVMFVGTEGKLFSDYGRHRLFPTDQFADYQRPEPTIPPSIGHHAEWLKACKEGTPTTCSFDYSGPLTETVLLGTVAYRTGKKLQWDAEALKATNCPEAAKLIDKEYRQGWEVV